MDSARPRTEHRVDAYGSTVRESSPFSLRYRTAHPEVPNGAPGKEFAVDSLR